MDRPQSPDEKPSNFFGFLGIGDGPDRPQPPADTDRPQSPDAGSAEPSLLGELGKTAMRGIGGVGEFTGHLMKATGLEKAGEAVDVASTDLAAKYPMSPEYQKSFVKRGILGGFESFPSSLSAAVPGAVVGGAIGAIGGPAAPITVPLGVVLGGALSGGTLMGVAEYQNFADEHKKETGKELDESSRPAAIKSALAEGGFELLSNLIGGSALTAPVKRTGATLLKDILRVPGANLAKRFATIEGAETTSEMATAYFQAKARQEQGMSTSEPMDATIEAILPAMTMGALFSVGGIGLQRMRTRRIENAMSDPTVPPEDRIRAAQDIEQIIQSSYVDEKTGEVSDLGKQTLEAWNLYTKDAILGPTPKPIKLDMMLDPISLQIESQMSQLDPSGTQLNVATSPEEREQGQNITQPAGQPIQPQGQPIQPKVFETLTPETADKMKINALQSIVWHGTPEEKVIAQAALDRKPKAEDSTQLHKIMVPREESLTERGERIAKFGRNSKPPMEERMLPHEEFLQYKKDVEVKRAERKEQEKIKKAEDLKEYAKEQTIFHQKMQELPEGSALRQALELVHEYGIATIDQSRKDVRSRDGKNSLAQVSRQVIPGHDAITTDSIRNVLTKFGFSKDKGINKKGKYGLDTLADEMNNKGNEGPPDIPGVENTGKWTADNLAYLLIHADPKMASKASESAQVAYLKEREINKEDARKARIAELQSLPELNGQQEGELFDLLGPQEDVSFNTEELDTFEPGDDVPFKSSSLYGRTNARLKNIHDWVGYLQKGLDENPSPELKARLEERIKGYKEEQAVILEKLRNITRAEAERSPVKKSGDDNAMDFFTRMDETPDHLTADQVISIFEQYTGGSFVYKWLAPLLDKYNVTINFDWKGEKLNDDDYGQYDKNLITFGSMDMFKKSAKGAHRQFATTFAHESIHAIIDNALRGNTQASYRLKSRLDNLRKELIDYHREHGGSEYISSIINMKVGELAAYGFTDEELAHWMNSIEGKATKGQVETLWGKFKRIILDFIQAESKQTPTKLDELNDILDEAVGITGVSNALRLTKPSLKQEQTELFKHGAFHGGRDVRKSKEGKLSLNHIGKGTGGGAQGHGLYFADLKSVAEYYRDLVKNQRGRINAININAQVENLLVYVGWYHRGNLINDFNGKSNLVSNKEILNMIPSMTLLEPMDKNKLLPLLKQFGFSDSPAEKKNIIKQIIELYPSDAALYKVELMPKPEDYLLWDEGFSGQSEKVKSTLIKLWETAQNSTDSHEKRIGQRIYQQSLDDNETGSDIYDEISVLAGSAKAASELLYSVGIRGNKYLDAHSRGINTRGTTVVAYYDSGKGKVPVGYGKTIEEARANTDRNWLTQKIVEIKFETQEAPKPTYNYVIFNEEDVEITDILTSLKGIDKRLLSQKLIEGSISPEDVKMYEAQLSNRIATEGTKGENKAVKLFRNTLQKIGAQYERTIGTDRERGFYNLPQTRERQGRAVDTQKSAIMAAGPDRFPIDFVEILRKERLTNEVILGLEQEKENIVSASKKAGKYTILHRDVQSQVRIKTIDKTIASLKKAQAPTFVHFPDGYKNKDFARANELARANGYELIPVKDHTGFVNAFINRATKQIFVETDNEKSVFQLVGHELSHVGVKGVASNKETQMFIDTTSAAFVTYRGELERSFGRKMKLEKVMSEYAADLQGGIEENYGVKLKEGLLPGTRIEVISKTADYEQFAEALPTSKEEAVNPKDIAALNEALIEDVDTKKNIALKSGLISMMQTMKPFLNTASKEAQDIYNKIEDFREFAIQALTNKNFAGWLNSVVDYSSRWKGEKAEFRMRSNAITGKEEPMRMETIWNKLERRMIEELGVSTTTRTKLDALTDLLNKTLPNAWAEPMQTEEAIAEAKRYSSVDDFIKAVSYIPTNKTRTVKDVKTRVFVNKDGKEWDEPLAFSAANLNNVGNATTDEFKKIKHDLYIKGWRKPSMYLRNVQLRQIWRTAHGEIAQNKREQINRTYSEQQVKNTERKMVGPAPREGKQGGKERSISKAAEDISISNRKISIGEDTALRGKNAEVAIEALDESLRSYARALVNAQLSIGKESEKVGLREKIHVGLINAIDKLYSGRDDVLALRTETYAEVLDAVEKTLGSRNEQYTLSKKEEGDLERAYIEIEAKRAAQKMAIKAGMPVEEVVIQKETFEIPSVEQLATNENLVRRGRKEIGVVTMEDLGNYINLQKLEINRMANIKNALAGLFKTNENADYIRYEIGTHWSPAQRAQAQDLGSMLVSLGGEFKFTENGSEYILTRDNFGTALEKGIPQKAEQAEEKLKQKKQEQGNLFGMVEQIKKDALDTMKNEADYAAVKEWLDANSLELSDEGEILNKNGQVIGVDEMMEKGFDENVVDALYDFDMSWKWHPVSLPGKVDARLSKLMKGGWVSALSEMSPDEATKFTNQVNSYGGIKHRTARKLFSLPYHNAMKSIDWKKIYHFLGELRVEHRERLTHKWIMKAQKYLNRRKYFKEAGYSNKERNDADYRIGRIVTIGDENLRNILFDLEKQVKEIDTQMEKEPLLRQLASLDKKRADLQAEIDRYNNDRAYSFEETQKGIEDEDGSLVKLNGKDAKLEYEMYRAIRSAEDSIFETTIAHMKNMLMSQYRNQKWFKLFSAALGQDLSDAETHGLVDKLQGVSTIPGISRVSSATKTVKGKKVTDADIFIKLGEIFKKVNITYDTFTDTTDVAKKYERIQSQLTKEMKELRDYVAELYGVAPTSENLLGEKKYAEIDQAIKEMFIAYQRTRPRLKQISDLRNDWRRWPAFFPRKREQGLMKFQMYENQVDPTTGVITKKEVFSGQFTNKAEAALLYSKIVDKYGENGELDMERYSFEYPAVSQMPDGSFDGIRDFNVQALIDTAFENMEMKGDFFDANGKPIDLKGQVWDAAYEAIAGQYQSRGASAHGIKRRQKPGEKAIKGYLEEGHDQILLGHITSMAGLLTKQEAALNVMDVMNNLQDKTRAPELREYIQGQLRNDNKWDRLSSKLRSLAFVWYLGAMVKSAGVNSTQPIIVGIPMLDNYMRDKKIKGSGSLAQLQASKDVAVNGGILFKDPSEWKNLKGISELDKRFLEEGVESGSMAAQHARFIKGQTSDWGRVWNKAFDYLALPFASVERYNRFSSGLAMFRIAYAYHLKNMGTGDVESVFENALNDATKFINDVHYPIGKHNLPILAQGGDLASITMKTAYIFRPFTHNFLLNQFNLLRSAAKLAGPERSDAEIRRQATNDLKTFVHTMALVALFGGLMGLPFLKDIFDWYEKHYGYSPRQWARETLRGIGGDTLETFGMSGLPAVLGGNISGSLSIGIPFVNTNPESIFGVYAGLAQKAGKAGEAAMRGDPYRTVTNLTPEFLRNPIVALTESDFGRQTLGTRGFATTPQGMPSYATSGKPLSLTTGEAAWKALGFQPTRFAKEREIEQSVKSQILWAKTEKKNISESFRIDRLQRDPNALKTMMSSVRELNTKIKSWKIPETPARISTIMANSRATKNLQKRRELKRRGQLMETAE